jgi:hypothetical protein
MFPGTPYLRQCVSTSRLILELVPVGVFRFGVCLVGTRVKLDRILSATDMWGVQLFLITGIGKCNVA